MLVCQSVEPCNNAGIKLMKHSSVNLLGHHDILNLCYHLLKAWSLKITSLEIRPFLNDATESTKSDKSIGSSENPYLLSHGICGFAAAACNGVATSLLLPRVVFNIITVSYKLIP